MSIVTQLAEICPDYVRPCSCRHNNEQQQTGGVVHFEDNFDMCCADCGSILANLEDLTLEKLDSFRSCLAAKLYADYTGNVNIRCKILIDGIPGIESTTVNINYGHFLLCIRLLGMLCSGFVNFTNDQGHFGVETSINKRLMEKFVQYYIDSIEKIKHENDKVNTILTTVLTQVRQMYAENVNIIEYYFDTLVPYVKSLREKDTTTMNEDYRVDGYLFHSPGHLFQTISLLCTKIRNAYAPLSVQFDGVFVMIYCLTCHDNLEALSNFILDYIYRICKFYFVRETSFTNRCKLMLPSLVNYRKNVDLHYVVRNISEGKCKESVSLEFLEKLSRLNNLLTSQVEKKISFPNDRVKTYAMSQAFPVMLFPSIHDYYGYIISLGVVMKNMNRDTKQLRKNTLTSARTLYSFVQKYSEKISQFQIPVFKLEVLELFVAQDEEFIENFNFICNHVLEHV